MITEKQLKGILAKHQLWLDGKGGERANLEDANLVRANLEDANLEDANLVRANLVRANLYGANLEDANLEDANLYGANLEDANTDKKYVAVSGIGSEERQTLFCVEDDDIRCGCFRGTLQELKDKVEQEHKHSPKYLAEYRAAITFFESVIASERAEQEAK